MAEKLVLLEEFSNETEAAVAKGFLEVNGISAHVFDNDPARRLSLRMGTNLDFGIRLMVSSSDLQEARELLKSKPLPPEENL